MKWIEHTWAGIIFCLHVAGVVQALHALIKNRTSQGTIAWMISLITFPYVAVPLYWFIGRDKFTGYVRARRAKDRKLADKSRDVREAIKRYKVRQQSSLIKTASKLAGLPNVSGNALALYTDGAKTFHEIFATIENAQHYILLNYYIFKNDTVGEAMQEILVRKARAGVRVYFLYDEIGSSKLPRKFLRELRDAGVEFHHFGTNRFWWSRLHYNFRNHRKIIVCDGKEALIGGLNVADEYLGWHPTLGYWRDTHMKICGPAVLAIQLVFLEDWYWASGEVLDLQYRAEESGQQSILILPTGPADVLDSWQLFLVEASNQAVKRLWIASPYFVPDTGVISALQAAALRGVDVRILLPDRGDNLLVHFATYCYYQPIMDAGGAIYRYTKGFLHQKVLLSDHTACVGTGNVDNRSFRLNFEIAGFTEDEEFVRSVKEMLEEDFACSYLAKAGDFTDQRWYFRAACRGAKLFSPLL